MDLQSFIKGRGKKETGGMEQKISEYNSKSKGELFSELEQAKKNGDITEESIAEFMNRFGSFMTKQQRESAEKLLRNIK